MANLAKYISIYRPKPWAFGIVLFSELNKPDNQSAHVTCIEVHGDKLSLRTVNSTVAGSIPWNLQKGESGEKGQGQTPQETCSRFIFENNSHYFFVSKDKQRTTQSVPVCEEISCLKSLSLQPSSMYRRLTWTEKVQIPNRTLCIDNWIILFMYSLSGTSYL